MCLASLRWRIKMLGSVQVCIGVKVVREHGVLDVNNEFSTDSALDKLSPVGFRLPEHLR